MPLLEALLHRQQKNGNPIPSRFQPPESTSSGLRHALYCITPVRLEGAMTKPSRLIIGITGASGVRYGVRLLQILRPLPVETHLVLSRTAEVTLACETNLKVSEVQALADHCHSTTDMAAPIASGSFRTM